MRSGSGSTSKSLPAEPLAAPWRRAARQESRNGRSGEAAAGERWQRLLACLRYGEILLLQGSPVLGAAFAIEAPFATHLGRLALLAGASLLLVAHVFLLNDWAGLHADLRDPNKAAGVFAARGVRRHQVGWAAAGALAASLLLAACLGAQPLVLTLAIAALSAIYSLPVVSVDGGKAVKGANAAKGVPVLGSALHVAGGALHLLLGYTAFRPADDRALALACFCGLVFAAGHLNQEVRDQEGDRMNGIATNAVAFGKTPTFLAGLLLFTLAYLEIAALAARGTLPHYLEAAAVLCALHLAWSLQTFFRGLTFHSVTRLQVRYRILFAVLAVALLCSPLSVR